MSDKVHGLKPGDPMTPLEKAARAALSEIIRQAESREPRHAGNGYVEPNAYGMGDLVVTVDHVIHMDMLARAVLMAVREPTGEMTCAATHDEFLEAGAQDRAGKTWMDMIDAILAEEPK